MHRKCPYDKKLESKMSERWTGFRQTLVKVSIFTYFRLFSQNVFFSSKTL